MQQSSSHQGSRRQETESKVQGVTGMDAMPVIQKGYENMNRTGRLFASLASVILTASLASCDNKPQTGKTDNLDTATREELASIAAKDSRLTGELENKTIKWMANWGFSAEKDPNLVVFQERYGGNIEETIIDWSVR